MNSSSSSSIKRRSPAILLYVAFRRTVLEWSKIWLSIHPGYHLRRWFFGSAVVPVNGFRMYMDLKNDTGISKDLYIFGKREHLSTDMVQSEGFIHSGDDVLDVGANIGYYALLESRLVGPSGRVFAIEPVSNNMRLLKKNIELNGITNIQTFQLAAGDAERDAEIHVAQKGNFSSFTYLEGEKYAGKEKVHVVTVDGFVAKHHVKPVLVRMDVEGYETEIIKGMRDTLKHRPKLLIEVHPHLMTTERLEEMFAAIAQAGYKQATVIKDRKHVWMAKNGETKPILRYLTTKIEPSGYGAGMGKLEHMSLDELRKTLPSRGSAFHVLIA